MIKELAVNILIVSFFDDNFGDMLIRICFERLLETALKNLSHENYTLSHMHIKTVEEEKIASSDMIFFAGGAMFGMNYLNSFEFIDRITALADEQNIPVVFSSTGINHKDANEESENKLREILARRCVRAMSVRESASLFSPYAPEGFEIVQVCDPAVWSAYVYSREVAAVRTEKAGDMPVIGINMVRGGLFRANGYSWTLGQQEEYIHALYTALCEQGLDCRFFTNGSVLDNNSLAHFVSRFEIPAEKVVYPDNTREVVTAIAGLDALVAIRMHAAIIAYALEIPSANMVWNEKLPEFYAAIGHPERAIPFEDCAPELMANTAQGLLNAPMSRDKAYMMSLYNFLLRSLRVLLNAGDVKPFTFDEVADSLCAMPTGDTEDIIDYRTKLSRTKKCYQTLFEGDLEKRREIKRKDKQLEKSAEKLTKAKEKSDSLKEKLDKNKAKLEKTNQKLEKTTEKLKDTKEKLAKSTADNKELKRKLKWLNSRFVVRAYRKLRSIFGLPWYSDRKDKTNEADR